MQKCILIISLIKLTCTYHIVLVEQTTKKTKNNNCNKLTKIQRNKQTKVINKQSFQLVLQGVEGRVGGGGGGKELEAAEEQGKCSKVQEGL